MKFLSIILPLFSTFTFTSEYDYRETKKLNLSIDGIEEFEIDCGAGFLEIIGVDGLKELEIVADIEIEGLHDDEVEDFLKRNMELSLEKKGDRAVLISHLKYSRSSFSFFGNMHAVINLTVKMPRNMNLEIDDGSGYIDARNIGGETIIRDRSGEMRIEEVKGNLRVKDGSGEIDIYNVEGNVDVDDGSGQVEIRKITGNVTIEDGSGSIYVKDVGGEVLIDDGSGSINVNDVEKDVTIQDDSSGGVSIRNVKGQTYGEERRKSRSYRKKWRY